MTTELKREAIIALLNQNDKADGRALVLINARQTSAEQSMQATRDANGRGFKPCHAFMGTSMAQFFGRTGYLSPKQLAYWRVKDKTGNSRIGCYWRQLVEEAKEKQKAA